MVEGSGLETQRGDTLHLHVARMLESHPLSPLMANFSAGIALMSDRETPSWRLCANWDLVADLHELGRAIDRSFRKPAEAAEE